MEQMIGFCGIVCTECKGYIATKNNDDNERKKIAEEWSKQFGSDIKPEDVNCDGCISEKGRHIGYCNICEIRKCGQGKKIINCAYCNEYACDKLNKFFEMAPDAKKTLESIKNNL
jgi:hypothetical protein